MARSIAASGSAPEPSTAAASDNAISSRSILTWTVLVTRTFMRACVASSSRTLTAISPTIRRACSPCSVMPRCSTSRTTASMYSEPETPLADQPARRPGADDAQVQHGRSGKLLFDMADGELRCLVDDLLAGQRRRGLVRDRRRVLPADALGLLAPQLAVGLAVELVQPGVLGRGAEQGELALGRQRVPVEAVALGVVLGLAHGRLVALGERFAGELGDRRRSPPLCSAFVVADLDAERPQLVGQRGAPGSRRRTRAPGRASRRCRASRCGRPRSRPR